jgi:Ca2+-binding EF-hand superfamily protein
LGIQVTRDESHELSVLHDCTGELCVDWKSFQNIVMDNYAKMDNSQMGKNAFELFATEGQNFIDYKNLEAVSKEVGAELSDPEIKAMIDTYDQGAGGSINKVSTEGFHRSFAVILSF